MMMIPIGLFNDIGGVSECDIGRIYLANFVINPYAPPYISSISEITPETKVKDIVHLIQITNIYDTRVIIRDYPTPIIPLTKSYGNP